MIVVIIPAKGDSSRLPNKNMILLNDKPLINYTIDYANNSKLIDKIYYDQVDNLNNMEGGNYLVDDILDKTEKVTVKLVSKGGIANIKDTLYELDQEGGSKNILNTTINNIKS